MREFQLQTPQRDQTSANRRSKSAPDVNKYQRKVTKKSLNHVFKAVSEEDFAILECSKEISEVSDDNPFTASPENFLAPVNSVDTPSSETVAVSDLTSPSFSSLSVTSDNHSVINAYEHPKLDSLKKIESVEAEMVIKQLREARVHAMKSNDVGHSKKLLDVLINIIIEDFSGGQYEEKECIDKLLSTKGNLVFLGFMLGILAVFFFWYSDLGAEGFDIGLTPT